MSGTSAAADGGAPTTRGRLMPAALAAALVALPILGDWALSGRDALVRYSAPDAFYYHVVARNAAHERGFSYDGTHPTNGFHPLWQVTLAGVAKLGRALGLGDTAYLGAVLLIGTALVAAALFLVGWAIARERGSVPVGFVWTPVGLYALLVLPYWIWAIDLRGRALPSQGPFPLFGTSWSYVNGMESGLVLLALAGLAWLGAAPGDGGARRAFALGGLATALAFARLDHALVALPFVLAAARARHSAAGALGRRLLPGAILALTLLAYLGVNLAYSGAALPVSGVAKSSFPHPTAGNFANLGAVVNGPALDALAPSRFYRAAQLFLPLAAAAVVLARRLRAARAGRWSDRFESFLCRLAWGVLLLAGYDLLFVEPFAMGSWYFPASTLLVSLAPFQRGGRSRSLTPRAAAAGVLATLAVFVLWQRRSDYHGVYARFLFEEGPALRARFGAAPPRILEIDDGIVAFATGFPALSGTGLALDAEAAEAARAGRLMSLALARGFDHVASLVYLLPTHGAPASDVGRRFAQAARPLRAAYPDFDFEPVAVAGGGYFVLLRARPRGETPGASAPQSASVDRSPGSSPISTAFR